MKAPEYRNYRLERLFKIPKISDAAHTIFDYEQEVYETTIAELDSDMPMILKVLADRGIGWSFVRAKADEYDRFGVLICLSVEDMVSDAVDGVYTEFAEIEESLSYHLDISLMHGGESLNMALVEWDYPIEYS